MHVLLLPGCRALLVPISCGILNNKGTFESIQGSIRTIFLLESNPFGSVP